ncbi:MAG: IMP cyclohydrolase [Candidatus Taylorbacteria bacterium]|nr:IMP cyclohydrolase [Candidatus Taylorbacteria bacterium]
MRALISVSDHNGLVPFAKLLESCGFEIISAGNTATHLRAEFIPVSVVDEITGFSETLGGRLTMFHPKIFGGIVANIGDPLHRDRLAKQKIVHCDLIVANLTHSPPIDETDAGRLSLLTAAAINFGSVVAIVDPADYREVGRLIHDHSFIPGITRQRLAAKALYVCSEWTNQVARQFRKQIEMIESRVVSTPTVAVTATAEV